MAVSDEAKCLSRFFISNSTTGWEPPYRDVRECSSTGGGSKVTGAQRVQLLAEEIRFIGKENFGTFDFCAGRIAVSVPPPGSSS